MPAGINLLFAAASPSAPSPPSSYVVFFHTASAARVAGGGTITLDEVNSMTKERFPTCSATSSRCSLAIDRAF